MDNEFILQDRLQKIQQIIGQYGEENFYISYSGGKDSNVLHALFDMALPGNRIPRVYCNTGIEYRMIVEFVEEKAVHDDRFVIIKPNVPIKKMLDEHGYPFKSKMHSRYVREFQNDTDDKLKAWHKYSDGTLFDCEAKNCPQMLRYQFIRGGCSIKISEKCCHYLKTDLAKRYEKENNKKYYITGIMREEGGRRMKASCLMIVRGKFKAFQPLAVLTKEWENWFIDKYNITLPALYYFPYDMKRTGCKGCPFDLQLQKDLDMMEQFLPDEKKQCEAIWKPVYAEYRRLGYRLRKVPEDQMMFKGCE